jgi:multiple sugar transport system substrate-binding protein
MVMMMPQRRKRLKGKRQPGTGRFHLYILLLLLLELCHHGVQSQESIRISILMDGVFETLYEYVQSQIDQYQALNPSVRINIQRTRGDYETVKERIIKESIQKSHTWDGAIFPSHVLGSLADVEALEDITDYVLSSEALHWPDVLPAVRENSYFDRHILTLPLDGDVLQLYYRKDWLQQLNLPVPRTWDEYTQVAEALNGLPIGGDTGDQPIVGSCISRINQCTNPYWTFLILSSMTQTLGTSTGFLLDPETLDPFSGVAMQATLRYMAEQLQFGADDELSGTCLGPNSLFSQGTCALTINWGDQMSELLNATSTDTANIGVAPTPGSTQVLDRFNNRLITCTSAVCPYGDDYDDIGRVNRAPYSAFGGWVAGISRYHGDDESNRAMADFFSFMTQTEQSLPNVLPGSDTIFAQPYRYSHLTSDEILNATGLDSTLARQYVDTIRDAGSLNAVLELKVPAADMIRDAVDQEVYAFLQNSVPGLSEENRRRLEEGTTENIDRRIREVLERQDLATSESALESYQRSLGIFLESSTNMNYIDSGLRQAGWGLAGLLGVACVILILWILKNRNHHVIKASGACLLLQCCLGVLCMVGTIAPLSFDEDAVDPDVLDFTCMLSPWLYVFGFTLLFSAIDAKIQLARRVVAAPKTYKSLRALSVSPVGMLKSLLGLGLINGAILGVWTALDPLVWTREQLPGADGLVGELPETYGTCRGETNYWIAFPASLLAVNLIFSFIAVTQAFRYRFLALEFSEIQWLPLSLLPFIEVWILGTPILVIFEDDPTGTFVAYMLIIASTCFGALMAIFAPKEWYVRKYNDPIRDVMLERKARAEYLIKRHPEVSLFESCKDGLVWNFLFT